MKWMNMKWMRLYLPLCLEACNLTALISSSGNSLDTAEATKIILSILGTFSFPRRCVLSRGFLKWKACFSYIAYQRAQEVNYDFYHQLSTILKPLNPNKYFLMYLTKQNSNIRIVNFNGMKKEIVAWSAVPLSVNFPHFLFHL